MAETWDIVDEQDNVIKQVTRDEARTSLFLHRSITIFIFNTKGEIFVHKRTTTKDIYPGMYDMACGGGVGAGETYETAAIREVQEEFGIKDPKLEFLFKMRYKSDADNIFIKVYKTVYDGKITLQKEEIVSGEFMSMKALKELMQKEEFCPDSVEVFKKFNSES